MLSEACMDLFLLGVAKASCMSQTDLGCVSTSALFLSLEDLFTRN